ncbi:MAG: hypothetical protein NTY35_01995 [Planctomycetota bacterium]|nr:hypothetical protein [Planctomycetota bacterium]
MRIAAAAVGLASLSLGAKAQGLIASQGEVLGYVGQQVPGLPAGVLYGGSGGFDSAVVDDAGRVLFRARFQGTGVLATNDRAYFYGSSLSSLALYIRSGDGAPGLPGITLNTATGTGFSGSPRLGPAGDVFFSTSLSGAGVTTANDTALFGGNPLMPVLLVREGDPAPSGGSTITTGLSGLSHQPTGMNRNGRFLFQASSLTGGDVVGSTNNAGWIVGSAGNTLQWGLRKGDTIPGGAVISALGFISQLNNAGNLLTEVTLSTTAGTTPATAANDRALLVCSPGLPATYQVAVREGDSAPGTVGATFSAASNSWFVSVPPNAFTAQGTALLHADLLNGDVVAGVNDRAAYIVSGTAAPVMAVRKGDLAPGTDGFFGVWNNSNSALSDGNRIMIQSTITGGTSDQTNNSGIWTGTPGNLQLAVREGQILPGTVATQIVGSVNSGGDNGFGSRFAIMNSAGQIYFETDLIGPDVVGGQNDLAWLVWDPTQGLVLLARRGEQLQVAPGVFKTISLLGGIQFSNGDGCPLSFSRNGVFVTRIQSDDGASGIVKVVVATAPGSRFCPGDGSVTACPCGNLGILGHGCANSVTTDGAVLTATGTASLANDTVSLLGAGMPNSSALYFQGTAQQSSGAGVAFGDGLRCVAGSIVRLGTKSNVAGASQYPSAGDLRVSVRGLVTTPGTRHYQVWYRNAAAFCTSSTFNLSNGWTLTWGA